MKHFLKFVSLGIEELYQIAEPIGFDGAKYVIEQNSKRYSRDIKSSLSKLRLVNAVNGTIETGQVINPFGDVSNRLDYGLDWVFPILKEYGFEAKIEYILEDNGTQFEVGLCDFSQKGFTDWKTYVEFNLIDKTDVADFKKQYDTKFNLFSDKNYRNETITPAQSVNILKKGVPSERKSKWNITQPSTVIWGDLDTGPAGLYFNGINNVLESNINNSLSFMYDDQTNPYDYRYIDFLDTNDNIKVSIKNVSFDIFFPSLSVMGLYYKIGLEFYSAPEFPLLVYGHPPTTNPFGYWEFSNIGIDFEIPIAYSGFKLWIYFRTNEVPEGTGVTVIFKTGAIEITAINKPIDTVVKGVRQIDALKQASKFIKDTPINAVDYQVGGKHYNNFVFNKRMVSGKTDFFYSTPKDLFENLIETNQDFENLENEIFVGHEKDFYKNIEIGALLELPSKDYNESYNDRFMINNLKYDFETFEQDRDATDTSKSVHTQSEWNIQNDGVENKKEVKVKFVRDGFAIQKMADLEISNPTTSTTDDDKVYIVKVVDIAPNSFGILNKLLYTIFDVANFKLIIYNTSSLNTENKTFYWDSLGLTVGQNLQILPSINSGLFTVSEIQKNFIKLTPLTAFFPLSGDLFLRIKYFYTNVQYTTQTTEGFINAPVALNTFYTIKRNLKYFYEQFATALMYSKKDILNLFFKNNGSFSSQLTTETEPVIENATILYSDLPTPILDAMEVNIDCVATMEQIKSIIENYKVNRGFIRVYNNDNVVKRVYFKKLEQEWSTNKLTLLAEKQYESGELELTINDGAIVVNGATYTLSVNWWRIENEYLQVFDENNLPISNKYKFNLVILNGLIYDSIFDLNEALLTL
jgi:hypothetical protein